MDRYYTSKEIQKLFKVSPITLFRWRKKQLIPFSKFTGKKILYPKDEIDEWMRSKIIRYPTE